MKVIVNEQHCTACGVCVRVCPQMILEVIERTVRVRDVDRCMGCFGCEDECPTNAVRVLRAPQSVASIEIEPPPAGISLTGGSISCDVAVVGAGPAGLGAAITCARAGLDVLVLERLPNRLLSHHADGGVLFTLPWMTSIQVRDSQVSFPELDITIQADFARECSAMGLLGPDGLSTDNQLPPGAEAWAGTKDRFVEALVGEAERAGARMWFNAKVVDVLRQDGIVTGAVLDSGTEIRARVVVTADGAFARISECAGMDVSHENLWYVSVLAFEYDNVADLPAGLYYLNGGLQFEAGMPPAFGGLGITDVVHVMLAFYSRKRTYPAPRPMDYYLQKLLETDARVHSLVGESFKGVEPRMLTGCRAPFRARCNEIPVRNGVVSVGDAWVDDGELGNVPALANGVHAGRVIVEAAQRDDFSAEALGPAADFVDKRLLRALAENKRMKLLGAELDDEGQRTLFGFMQHMNYPIMMFGTPGQNRAMFARFFVKNLWRFVRYPEVARMFF